MVSFSGEMGGGGERTSFQSENGDGRRVWGWGFLERVGGGEGYGGERGILGLMSLLALALAKIVICA